MNLLLFLEIIIFTKDFIYLIARTSNAKAREQILKCATKSQRNVRARLDDKFVKSIREPLKKKPTFFVTNGSPDTPHPVCDICHKKVVFFLRLPLIAQCRKSM